MLGPPIWPQANNNWHGLCSETSQEEFFQTFIMYDAYAQPVRLFLNFLITFYGG